MPVCEICGQNKAKIVACRVCGVRFCNECGHHEKNLCFDCATTDEESMDDEVDVTFEESTGAE